MSNFAILRIKKLPKVGNVSASLKHAFRERETPNADPERAEENQHVLSKSYAQAMHMFNERLPDKVRKNGVRCVEYLVTGSPEAINAMTRTQQDKYFSDSLRWLFEKHGRENVFYAGVHRDESTPHMYAYVVPIDERGKLNARHFFGGRDKLSQMQTQFAQEVAYGHGLVRGVENSRAKHQTIRQYYGRMDNFDRTLQEEVSFRTASLAAEGEQLRGMLDKSMDVINQGKFDEIQRVALEWQRHRAEQQRKQSRGIKKNSQGRQM